MKSRTRQEKSAAAASADDSLRLKYLYGGVAIYRAGETLGPRTLTDYELVLVIDGKVIYRRGNQSFTADPGTVILATPEPWESYRWDPHRETRHAYIHFDIQGMPSNWPSPREWPIVTPQPDQLVPVLFRHVVHHCVEHGNWPAQPPSKNVSRLMEVLLGELVMRDHEDLVEWPPSRPQPVQRALKYMRERIDEAPEEPITLDDLATAANVSAKHLCRLFEQNLGHSPMRTYRLLRLQLGVVLLSRSNLSIKQIAGRCGFGSQFQFSRDFSQAFNHSPREIRSKLLRGQRPPKSPLPADLMPRVYW